MAGFIWEAPFRPAVEEKKTQKYGHSTRKHKASAVLLTFVTILCYEEQSQVCPCFKAHHLQIRMIPRVAAGSSSQKIPSDLWMECFHWHPPSEALPTLHLSPRRVRSHSWRRYCMLVPRPALSTLHALEAAQLCVSAPSFSQYSLFLLSH